MISGVQRGAEEKKLTKKIILKKFNGKKLTVNK